MYMLIYPIIPVIVKHFVIFQILRMYIMLCQPFCFMSFCFFSTGQFPSYQFASYRVPLVEFFFFFGKELFYSEFDVHLIP